MTASTRPREADISRYRHGCDPPEQKAKVASLSACKGRRALTRFRIHPQFFDFTQRKGKVKTARCGIGLFEQAEVSVLPSGAVGSNANVSAILREPLNESVYSGLV